MGERVLDQIQDLSIKFGVGAVHFQFDLFAEFGREVAHDPRQFLPRIADRLHPGLHHPFLKLGSDVGEPLQRHLEFGFLMAPHDFKQLVASEHQFGDHRHQIFQSLDIDSD